MELNLQLLITFSNLTFSLFGFKKFQFIMILGGKFVGWCGALKQKSNISHLVIRIYRMDIGKGSRSSLPAIPKRYSQISQKKADS